MKQILITAQEERIRAAVLQEGRLLELLDDAERESRLAGSIFKGRVMQVVPGMQAAFLDIGLSKNGFLYVGDAVPPTYAGEVKVTPTSLPRIEHLLKEGQELVVQIAREQSGKKGPRVTTHLGLPGRYVVLLPGLGEYIGVSKKIKDPALRKQLKEIGLKYKPPQAGLILRTLAAEAGEKELREDLEEVLQVYAEMEDQRRKVRKGLLYSSNDPLARLLRQSIDAEVEKIIVDDPELAESLRQRLRAAGSEAAGKIWTDLRGDLFGRHGVLHELQLALSPKVALPSGGDLVIQQMEALTVIDVNTGKYIGEHSVEQTLLQNNLEAAEEIARQIRLRNIGGIILIDFIDMEEALDWQGLLKHLEQSLGSDSVKTRVLGRTSLGLVEMTRKKEGQTLATRYTETCPHCNGKGRIHVLEG